MAEQKTPCMMRAREVEPDVIYGIHAIREALRSGTRPLLRIVVTSRERRFGDILALARSARVPVHCEPRVALDRLVPGGHHQGIVGVVGAKPYVDAEVILGSARTQGHVPLLIIVDGIEDPRNLGAVVRTAEAAGAHGIFLPERRAVGLTGTVARASAGALEHVPVSRVPNLSRLIESLQAEGLWIYGLDPSAKKPYTSLDLRGPVGLVLGAEGKGARPGVLQKCDALASIPMQGRIASLNVSAAAAVVLFEAVRQRSGGRLSGSG